MIIFIHPYEDHIAIGAVSNNTNYVDSVRSGVPSGIPFFIFMNDQDMIPPKSYDDIFFEALTCNFNDPDGYGTGLSYEELVKYNSEHNIDNIETINEVNKVKNRTITINMSKARLIWKDKLRIDRKPLLENLDVQYMRALERGETESIQKIVKKKEFLRDVTDDPRFEIASNIDELKEIVIPPNFIEE